MAIDLMPHQAKALESMSDGCVLTGEVGSGKTIAALAYYKKYHSDKKLYVITTARKRDEGDWTTEAALMDIDELVVDSWQNIANYLYIDDGFVIADEQRLVGGGVWSKSFIRIAKKNPWIMLSATPGDNWLDFATIFIAKGYYKNITQFKREHVVYSSYAKFPKVERYIGVGRLLKHRANTLVPMPFKRHTIRHTVEEKMVYNEPLMKTVRETLWNVYEDEPLRDAADLIRISRRLVNTDPSRLARIRELVGLHKKLVVFYSFNYELDILRGLSDVATVAEWNGHRHQPIPEEDDRWVYLVQYTAGAEGWNCVLTDRIVFYSLQYSYKLFEQSKGRIDRLNTPFTDLYYHVLKSDASVDQMIWKALCNKRSFNERKLRQKLDKEIFEEGVS